jgi:hypothetical protein
MRSAFLLVFIYNIQEGYNAFSYVWTKSVSRFRTIFLIGDQALRWQGLCSLVSK